MNYTKDAYCFYASSLHYTTKQNDWQGLWRSSWNWHSTDAICTKSSHYCELSDWTRTCVMTRLNADCRLVCQSSSNVIHISMSRDDGPRPIASQPITLVDPRSGLSAQTTYDPCNVTSSPTCSPDSTPYRSSNALQLFSCRTNTFNFRVCIFSF